MERFAIESAELLLEQGDITRQRTEAIANAANSSLLGGGGVDGAIHRAAGPALLQACRAVASGLPGGRLETGGAAITPGFGLAAAFVVHCAGPIYGQHGGAEARLLARCYRRALELCRERALSSIAFPSISTGVYGYPVEEAAEVALGAVREGLRGERLPREVRFVLFDARTYRAYRSAAEALLGPPQPGPGPG